MRVFFVGAGPGDPDLITVKGRRLVVGARICIYAGSLVSPELVDLIPPDAEKYDSAELTLEEIIDICRRASDRGVDVVRLHSGDPAIYGAIKEQMRELDREGIEYEVIPGLSSFQAAAAAIGAELTAPEISQTIILTRTAGRTPVPETEDLERLAATKATLCIFLSANKIREIAKQLMTHYGPDCPMAIVYRASWPDQEIVQDTLENIASREDIDGFRKTTMIIVGRALSKGSTKSKLYDADFSHAHRKGKKE